MKKSNFAAIDGNEAAARVAYALSEVIAIYPITPSSNMGESSDAWAAARKPNIWGAVPTVIEMQSEAGASGALHGAVSTGALATTFTSSQGLLLMIPVMYKVGGELAPVVFHVAARTIATHALSIFGDHSDVMSVRGAGLALLCSGNVQEVTDLGAIAHAATLETRLPFVHFFDGFRTSHEILKIQTLSPEDLRQLVEQKFIDEHRRRALNPEHPTLKGTAQNPDAFFQAREAANPYYIAAPDKIQAVMDRFAKLTGRGYKLFDYVGHPQAEQIVVMMGSGCGATEEAAEALNAKGGKVGVLKVRLYRPFDSKRFVAALPASVKKIAVLDRAKEPGGLDPLHLDVLAALDEAWSNNWPHPTTRPRVIGGRYGLSSKEYTPAMAAAVFQELSKDKPKNPFTVGITDDVTHLSLDYDPGFSTEAPETQRAVFYGLGADGTVGANKNSIKLIAEQTDMNAQGYFVYDSKKSGSMTISHLRFGPKPIRASCLVNQAQFVACHQERLMETIDVVKAAAPGATFLLNCADPETIWTRLPANIRKSIVEKKLKFYAIDAYKVAREAGLGPRINTVMQTCYFHITQLLPGFMDLIKGAIKKSYSSKGEAVVAKNIKAVDGALAGLIEVKYPAAAVAGVKAKSMVPDNAPKFVKEVTAELMAYRGDELPVSAFPADGTFPTGTTKWEKRAIAQTVPHWDPSLCIQCAKCSLVCPHAAIRVKAYPEAALAKAPKTFVSTAYKGKEFPASTKFTVQLAPEDCTGCNLCAVNCPGKDKADPMRKALMMVPLPSVLEKEKANFDFFLTLPYPDRRNVAVATVKGSQMLEPLFEFSGACAGCGETPYVKLLTQLVGDRLVIGNATGCSSIYGGNLPTTPFTVNKEGRGPAWSNSLFEDNAEFGLGFRLAIDQQKEYAESLLKRFEPQIGKDLVAELLSAKQNDETGIAAQRERVAKLRQKLAAVKDVAGRDLDQLADGLVRKSVWIVGGDGWAYDIGYGGLDHVLRSGRNVKVLVLDTEVYSNTGGQASKATPRAATARFAVSGKKTPRKDLALTALGYGNCYVARIAMGASDAQTVKAFAEAEAYDGPAIIIAYSHCIAHGFNIEEGKGLEHQKLAVDCGYWPLIRYNPDLLLQGKNPLQIDSKPGKIPVEQYLAAEQRYKVLHTTNPEEAHRLAKLAAEDVKTTWKWLDGLFKTFEPAPAAPTAAQPDLAKTCQNN
ncbi:MAG TPA: pyruvate:ferredoxin (flavodoxin) oxidoreductase [Elusimicrobia bacterium]|nr:pyruvate:ferredoxin (flavodoxin) oxidoreductase [Elusimicrobiota bacterium]HBT61571.1 pyruvate:ferredoxin (flavodoxin) oxidoreductase [Elusimicrobiota bacterium]